MIINNNNNNNKKKKKKKKKKPISMNNDDSRLYNQVVKLNQVVSELNQQILRFEANCQQIQALQSDLLTVCTTWTLFLAPDLAPLLQTPPFTGDHESNH